MKIQYLGTAAAEGVPGLFCQCDNCVKARALGGKNIRTRSQSLIDGRLLIDFPADTYHHAITYGIDMATIRTCLITHDHGDHLYPLDIANRKAGMEAHLKEEVPLCFYGPRPACEKLNAVAQRVNLIETGRIQIQEIKPFLPFVAEGYTVTPLKAAHAERCEPVIYLIEKDGKSLLYGNDTGLFPEETWDYLKTCGVSFDLVSLDCTIGLWNGGWGMHMNLVEIRQTVDRMQEYNLVDDHTVLVANHFAHQSCGTYEELKAAADEIGFLTSYDGMTVEF